MIEWWLAEANAKKFLCIQSHQRNIFMHITNFVTFRVICLVEMDAIKMLIPHLIGVYTGAKLSKIYLSFFVQQ